MSTEEVIHNGNLAVGDELCTGSRHEARERMIFGLALALASEPSKLGQLRQMLVHLQEQRVLALDFSTWALGRLDERVMSMALAYAHKDEPSSSSSPCFCTGMERKEKFTLGTRLCNNATCTDQ